MPAISASAPGKVILFGEHAVVYGQPAIAAPVHSVSAKAIVTAAIQAPQGRVHLAAPQIGLDADLDALPKSDPLAAVVRAGLHALGIQQPPAFNLRVNSTIAIAGGLGSGAAVSVAVLRAMSAFLGQPLRDEQVSALAFEVEKLHHGTPSGIDNTVITYAKLIFFAKGRPVEFLQVATPFTLLIAETGFSTPTRETVGALRAAWQADPPHYERFFAQIGDLATRARRAILAGDLEQLGPLMDANQELLLQLDVSSPELDNLVAAAKAAGALGAKLTGSGRGGNMLALVRAEMASEISAALERAGAVGVIITSIQENS
ncbi:MAG: mevalonate kinase [Anaerolineales bacterium]